MTISSDVITLLNSFSFDRQVIPSLPPDVRDQLLLAVQRWGDPQEQIALIDILREAHGPLLFFLAPRRARTPDPRPNHCR